MHAVFARISLVRELRALCIKCRKKDILQCDVHQAESYCKSNVVKRINNNSRY